VIVSFVNEKIDEKGRLVDEKTRKKIGEVLEALVVWTEKLQN